MHEDFDNNSDRGRTNSLYLMLGTMQSDIKSIIKMLGHAEAKHDTLSKEVDQRLNAHSIRMTAMEKQTRDDIDAAKAAVEDRIKELEKWRWKAAGITALIPTVLVVAGWVVTQV